MEMEMEAILLVMRRQCPWDCTTNPPPRPHRRRDCLTMDAARAPDAAGRSTASGARSPPRPEPQAGNRPSGPTRAKKISSLRPSKLGEGENKKTPPSLPCATRSTDSGALVPDFIHSKKADPRPPFALESERSDADKAKGRRVKRDMNGAGPYRRRR